ncbi:hypothetical protein SPB21_18940 [Leptothoe sp. ISB3NOV94-8A]
MPRRTQKYLKALETAQGLNISQTEDQSTLYVALNEKNFFWDSGDQRWVPGMEPNPASDLIRIRVWAAAETVKDAAQLIVRRLTRDGLELIEQSDPYPCRPPKQLESRIYLTFRED